MHTPGDTIVAPATPSGEGALAIVRLSGGEALEIGQKLAPTLRLKEMKSHTARYAIVRDTKGKIIDECVLTLYRNPTSFTGEDMVEITCHGSDFIVQRIVELAIVQGARMADPGEFTMRAFMHGKMDLSQAEAVIDLIQADSEAAHDQAIHQLRGGFSKDITLLREKIIAFAALIELELDFGEEDVAFADRTQLRATVEELLQFISKLQQSFQLGNAIKKGIPTVIAGRPNAGKSTLLNALLNEDRAIISDIPGTTRDTIEAGLVLRGVRFRITDTAGIRHTEDTIEALGVNRALDTIANSHLILYLYDAATLSHSEVLDDLKRLELPQHKMIIVANKSDLVPDSPALSLRDYPHIYISAKEQNNIDALRDKMYEIVVGDAYFSDRSIVTNTRHFEALTKAYDSLMRVQLGLDEGIPSDLIAMDIRQASYHLGSITGQIEPDDLLEYVFSNFCIGK